MKNERLKTDLITNVSHDIKDTSYVHYQNYVDLLKRELLRIPRSGGYLDILEAKAQRLKTLTEDVVGHQGQLRKYFLEYMDINLTEMIQQTSGEFEEKFRKRRLTEVLSIRKNRLLFGLTAAECGSTGKYL